MNKYFSLLKAWCDKMIELQVPDSFGGELAGGILCPACNMIHGRCADVIYPLLTMADNTKDEKYLKSALRVFDWSLRNMKKKDGSNINDLNNDWRGVSIFFVVSIAESIIRHGALLPKEEKEKWLARAKEICDFLSWYMIPVTNTFNVNYRCGAAQMYAMMSVLFPNKKEHYLSLARINARDSISFITKDNLLSGESKKNESDNGCFDVDLGYEAEESIPALYSYAKIAKDSEVMEKVVALSYEIANFYLADGALDNSFGSRSAKWTYWGSRTSDGCQLAFCDLAKVSPLFGEIAERNFEIYKKCTVNGLLCASPVYESAKESPCVHHTFCHAKALAHMVDEDFQHTTAVTLPAEKDGFFKHYPSMNGYIFTKNGYRCSIASPHYVGQALGLYPTGGSVTLLYHKEYGMIFAGSMPNYKRIEPENMQTSRHTNQLCNTPRLVDTINGRITSDMVYNATIKNENGCFTVKGELEENRPYKFEYSVLQNGFNCKCESDKNTKLIIPLVCNSTDEISFSENTLNVYKNNCTLTFTSSEEIKINNINERNFNPCGAFETLMIEIHLKNGIADYSIGIK